MAIVRRFDYRYDTTESKNPLAFEFACCVSMHTLSLGICHIFCSLLE